MGKALLVFAVIAAAAGMLWRRHELPAAESAR
jgi:hypothetical protein